MWDNAPLLRVLANVLFLISMCAALFGAVHYLIHMPGLLPLSEVRLSAAPRRVDPSDILSVVRSDVQGNFFTVDIERFRKSLERLPWVRSVSVRREFPKGLEVTLEEHLPLATWNKDALVNQHGEVFVADGAKPAATAVNGHRPSSNDGTAVDLPEFIGQDGTSVEVTDGYLQFSRQLAALGLRVTKLALSPRHAWELHLSNGMVLELGREDVQQRLAVFVQVYPYSLAALQTRVKHVDLRYRNGFSVSGLTNQG
jgi:cell division protein FtsQ